MGCTKSSKVLLTTIYSIQHTMYTLYSILFYTVFRVYCLLAMSICLHPTVYVIQYTVYWSCLLVYSLQSTRYSPLSTGQVYSPNFTAYCLLIPSTCLLSKIHWAVLRHLTPCRKNMETVQYNNKNLHTVDHLTFQRGHIVTQIPVFQRYPFWSSGW